VKTIYTVYKTPKRQIKSLEIENSIVFQIEKKRFSSLFHEVEYWDTAVNSELAIRLGSSKIRLYSAQACNKLTCSDILSTTSLNIKEFFKSGPLGDQ